MNPLKLATPVKTANRNYETWLKGQVKAVKADLAYKHQVMAESPFIFLRGTFFRWAEIFPLMLPALMDCPILVAVGDLHIENFGTWRDHEGRLAWGINDFDESFPMPYSVDLVRLATSALFAIKDGRLSLDARDVCKILTRNYTETIADGGAPIVLAEDHQELGKMARARLKNPARFYKNMQRQTQSRTSVPREAEEALLSICPEPGMELHYYHRTAGVGSLGRERYLVLTDYRGGLIARECKNALPSAWGFIHPDSVKDPSKLYIDELVKGAHRSPDPFYGLHGQWIRRRLAPDCARVELNDLPVARDEETLITSMGVETANVHLSNAEVADDVLKDLSKRPKNWLCDSATIMFEATVKDWKGFKA
ncbi:MAG: DUF2252 family protein [Cyanobacteria bacterium SZAS LIN-3]|nr:DUF2252 family protein [Cyanobacteria bacterium SZAS LIN-3]